MSGSTAPATTGKTQAPEPGRAARILSAADSYQAIRERRPLRPALDATDAEAQLLREAIEGRLSPEAVDAVLAAAICAKTAGHHIQHIFDKTGARTRSAATVWAFEHHLVQAA